MISPGLLKELMQKVIIGTDERTVILAPTYLKARKLNQKYGLESGLVITGSEYDNFIIDAFWQALKRGRIFKPYITRGRMIKHMTPWDMDRMRHMFDWVYTGHIFTEEELSERVKEAKKRIEAEIKKAVEKASDDYLETKVNEASEALKKN